MFPISVLDNPALISARPNALVIALFLCISSYANAQKFTVNGFVKDSTNGESISNAMISVKSTNLSATTNSYGFFSLTLPKVA